MFWLIANTDRLICIREGRHEPADQKEELIQARSTPAMRTHITQTVHLHEHKITVNSSLHRGFIHTR